MGLVVICIRRGFTSGVAISSLTGINCVDRESYFQIFRRYLRVAPVRCVAGCQLRGTYCVLMRDGSAVSTVDRRYKLKDDDFFKGAFQRRVKVAPVRCQGG